MIRVAFTVALLLGACDAGDKEKPIVLGEVAQPFGAVADVRVGMTLDEVRIKAPSLKFRDSGRGPSAALYPKGGTFNVEFENGKVNEIRIQLFKRTADELVKKWGPGMPTGNDGRQRYFTTDRTARADVSKTISGDSYVVTWIPMRPLADLLGADNDATTFAGVKLLDRRSDEALAELNKQGFDCKVTAHQDIACARMPAIEWSMGAWGRLSATANPEGIVTRLHLFWTPDEVESSKQAILDAYKRKWGEPKNDRGRLVYVERPLVQADTEGAGLSVERQEEPPATSELPDEPIR